VPGVIVLDPDGDMVRYLKKKRDAVLNSCWACYHSELYNATYKDFSFGIIGCAVGAAYAVLLAEQLFVSGCELLISVTSAGKLSDIRFDYVLIHRTLRNEGTSYHYLPSDEPSSLDVALLHKLSPLVSSQMISLQIGNSWTMTRRTVNPPPLLQGRKPWVQILLKWKLQRFMPLQKQSQKKWFVIDHITNSMAQEAGDFEKGVENGSLTSLELVFQTAKILKV
jgi:hypothetical protein